MIFYMMTFDTYEVIAPRNVYLGVDSVVEAIGMDSIVVKVMVEGIIEINCTTRMFFHVPKLQTNLFSLSKFSLNGLKVQIT